MQCKYFIPSEWNQNEKRLWEDIWLLPDDKSYGGESIWLTIDSLTFAVEYLSEEAAQMSKVQAGGFYIDGTNMLVGVNDFSREELLYWVAVWLKEADFMVTELIEGTNEEFKDTNDHARGITEAKRKFEKMKQKKGLQ